MARFGSKHLAIKQLGLGESAAIVVAQRRIEEGGGRGPRPDGRIRAGLPNAPDRGATLASVHFIAVAGLKIEIEQFQAGLPPLNVGPTSKSLSMRNAIPREVQERRRRAAN
jgi:hypothetical protein